MSTEIPLLGGTANRGRVHRVGDTVRRPLRPTSPGVHALLRHLEDVGFEGAPRVLGIDGAGREVLTYIPGHAITAPAPAWALTDAALSSVGRLLRRFHDATAGFEPAPHTWLHTPFPPFHEGRMIHNDTNLDNIVFREGEAVALIDFDLASPGNAIWDIACTARSWAPLRPDGDVLDVRRGRQFERLRVLVEAYGLCEEDRGLIKEAVIGHHDWMYNLVAGGAQDGVPGFAEYWTPETRRRAARARKWLTRSSRSFIRYLGA